MTVTEQRHAVTSIERLREIINQPKPDSAVMRKQLDTLDAHCRAFIAKAPFLLLSTSGASGRCDVSPRGDGPGFVLVPDERTLVIPDRPGNRRLDSFQNIIENPHAGLIFMVPNVDETLRVNGRAWLSDDPDLLARMPMGGKNPSLGIVIEVEEIYFHCARAFKRARLWEPDSWIDRTELPTLGQILHDQLNPEDTSVADYDSWLDESNKKLY
ncbi:pyridoxamine 5'-phosphate oxidase family protein [soil metagenome]